MKKIFLFTLFLTLFTISCVMAQNLTLYENYNASATDYGTTRSAVWRMQSFTVGTVSTNENFNVSYITLKMRKQGSPVATLNFMIKKFDNATQLTIGEPMITGNVSTTVLPTTSTAWFNVSMNNNNTVLNMSETYAFIFNCPSCSDADAVLFDSREESDYSGGNWLWSLDSGASWTSEFESDVLFQIWGYNATGTESTPINITDYFPQLTLNSPANNLNTTTTEQTFNCSATDDFQLENISLFINDELNYSENFTGLTSAQINRTINFSYGIYNWSCWAYDNATQLNVSATRSLEISSTPVAPAPTPVPTPVPATESAIYKLSESAGAGISIFISLITSPLALLVLGVTFVVLLATSIFSLIFHALRKA